MLISDFGFQWVLPSRVRPPTVNCQACNCQLTNLTPWHQPTIMLGSRMTVHLKERTLQRVWVPK